VHEIGPRKLEAACDRAAKAGSFDHGGGHGKPEGGEPGDCWQDVQEEQRPERKEDDDSRGEGDGELPPRHRPVADEDRAADERRGYDRRAGRQADDGSGRATEVDQDDVEDGRAEPQRERRPEVLPIEANRLGNELTDGPRFRRQGGRKLLRSSRPGHAPNATAGHRQ
jgi:hypothetical protein